MPLLTIGDAIPWFTLPSTRNPNYHFETVGGQRAILCFFGRAQYTNASVVIQQFCQRLANRDVLFFGVSVAPEDAGLAKLVENAPNCDLFWDFDSTVSQQCGVHQVKDGQVMYQPSSFILDETLRVLQAIPLKPDEPEQHVEQVMAYLEALPLSDAPQPAVQQAPVLLIPRVFEPDFCHQLIHLLETDGGQATGLLENQDGQFVDAYDDRFKRRRDLALEKAGMSWIQQVQNRVLRRIQPEVGKAFHYRITSFERPIVACYDAQHQGFFAPHRDNVTFESANRRFALTINLNTGSYVGGCLQFPEYGSQLFSPDIGGAVVFSCSLMHQVTPVTQGQRYAFLAFFNDLATERAPSSQTQAAPKATHSAKGFQSKAKQKHRR